MSNKTELVRAGLAKRYAREKRFRFYGLASIVLSLSFLAILLTTIFMQGFPAFTQTYMKLEVNLSAEALGVEASAPEEKLRAASYETVVMNALNARFPVSRSASKRLP